MLAVTIKTSIMIKEDITPKIDTGLKEYTAEQKAREEGSKLYYDVMKHLTTLSTGSILLLVTFLEKLFVNPKWRLLIAVTLVFFILSIITGFMSMIHSAYFIRKLGNVDEDIKRADKRIFYFSAFSFILAIICLAVFALRNLY